MSAKIFELRPRPPGEIACVLGDVLSRKWLSVIERGSLPGDCTPRPKLSEPEYVTKARTRAMEAINGH